MRRLDFDDKDLAMIVITLIAVVCLALLGGDAKEIAMASITAIAGLATGRRKLR